MTFAGKRSAQQVALVQRQGVAFQKVSIFGFKGNFRVVEPLSSDVEKGIPHLRLADRKRAVAVLPGKAPHFRPLRRYPFGRFAFQTAHEFTDGSCGNNTNKQVDMVLNTTNLKGLDLVSTADSTKVAPHLFLDVLRDPTLPVFGENDMQVNAGVGVSHEVEVSDRSIIFQASIPVSSIFRYLMRRLFVRDLIPKLMPSFSTTKSSPTIAVGFSPR